MPLLTTSLYQLVSKLQDVFEIAQQAASNRCRTRKEITIPYSIIRTEALLFFQSDSIYLLTSVKIYSPDIAEKIL